MYQATTRGRLALLRYHMGQRPRERWSGRSSLMNFFDAVRRALWRQSAPGNLTLDAGPPASSAGAAELIRSTESRRGVDMVDLQGPNPHDPVASRQRRAAERLLEDEQLRGSMTDEELNPLLEWALATVDRVAAATAGESDAVADERIERAVATIRRVFAAADRVLALAARRTGKDLNTEVQSLIDAATPPLVPPDEVASRRARITAALDQISRAESGSSGGTDDQAPRAILARRLAEVLGEGLRPQGEVLR